MNAITSRHCRLFANDIIFSSSPVLSSSSSSSSGIFFFSFLHSSPYLLCLHVGFYLDWWLFRRCSPNNDSVHLAVTHASIFAQISLVRTFSFRRDRGRFQEEQLRESECVRERERERERETRNNTVSSSPADVSLITGNNSATLRRDEKPRTTCDISMKE